MAYKKFFKYSILVGASAASLGLSACSLNDLFSADFSREPQTTEELLNAQGSWSLIEDKSAPTPFQQHVNARSAVDSQKVASTGTYRPEFRTATQNEQDVNFRLLRMERAVSGLRQDLNKLLPPLSNLIVADVKLDRAIREIAAQPSGVAGDSPAAFAPSTRAAPPNLIQSPRHNAFAPTAVAPQMAAAPQAPQQMAPPQQMKPVMAPAPMMQQQQPKPMMREAAAPQFTSSQPGVNRIRTGVYPNRTRLVLDVQSQTPFSVDVDNSEKLMLVELPSASWNAAAQSSLARNPLVAGYNAQDNGSGGTTLVVELKKPARVSKSSALPPNGQFGSHRIFFDIVPL